MFHLVISQMEQSLLRTMTRAWVSVVKTAQRHHLKTITVTYAPSGDAWAIRDGVEGWATAGILHFTDQANASVTFKFAGGYVWFIGWLAEDMARFQVTLDGDDLGTHLPWTESGATEPSVKTVLFEREVSPEWHELVITNVDQGRPLTVDQFVCALKHKAF